MALYALEIHQYIEATLPLASDEMILHISRNTAENDFIKNYFRMLGNLRVLLEYFVN